jgi:Tol biopolymer transport system component/predicted Ser/Thr protein kinase
MSDRWQQIEELYHAAREDRAVLDKADPELRREVESLLAQEKGAGFLEAPALEVAAQQLAGQDLIGRRIGSYQILSQLGAGGMGEVYRAKDTKLKREVALKVLPEAFAGDPARMARFQREAEVLASLNHPNIAQIYGIEERALVMELVPGKTLKGPLPIDTALNYAKQIADALEAAHDKGITHRDLKPSNIMITPTGVVKVLDFGLAAYSPAHSPAGDGGVSTLTMSPTQAGAIMGTAGYMSPEQARGEPVDKRADIWAFGVVLYEMLTGKPALTGEPEWDRVPQKVQRLLRSCLEKDPKQRLQAIGDWRLLLEDPQTATAPLQSRLGRIAWGVAGLAVACAVVVSFLYVRESQKPQRQMRSSIAAPENSSVHSFAVSPDGRYVAIAAAVNGKRQLWLRPLDALQEPMAGTEDATLPFWSPDSRYIGFFAQGKLKKIAASGGPSQSLCNAADGRGGSWSREDVIVFSPEVPDRAIQRVQAAGGVPSDVTKTKGTHLFPVFLPGGSHFLYVVRGSPENNGVYLSSLDGNENRRVLADESSVAFAAGHLLFIRENTLMAQPFDAGSGQASGDALPIAEGVSFASEPYFAPVTVSENGVLLYASGGFVGSNQIVWYDRAGKLLGPVVAPGNLFSPSMSPDEKMVAFSRSSGRFDIWLRDLARGTDRRVTSDASVNQFPVWSPKGDRIAFTSNRGGVFNLYQRAANGSGQDELLLSNPNNKFSIQWSRDGRFLVYSEGDPKTKADIWVLPVGVPSGPGADRKPIPFLKTEFREFQGQLSPDSRWMAYTSDESGQLEVYVRPFPASEGIWRISTTGGAQPRWRGDGRELLFVGANGKMTAVAVKAVTEPKPSFEAGAPVPLFDAHVAAIAGPESLYWSYDVTADGKRFLVNTDNNLPASPPLTVVVNWQVGLKK